MSELMISVAGIRGIVGDNVTPELFAKFAAAYGSFIGGVGTKLVIGRDTRVSGEMLKSAVVAGLISVGCTVVDIGISPTPTVGIMVKKLKADGGIVLSASHNPVEWNALKLVWNDGIFMDAETGKKFITLFQENKINYVSYSKLGKVLPFDKAIKMHQDMVLSVINTALIRKKRFKVVLDTCNGAGAVIIPGLLKQLGCRVNLLNGALDGKFAHNPEPVPENLTQLCRKVKSEKADFGIATDPDVDRVAFVSEKGIPIGEENTLALCVDYLLKKRSEVRGQKSEKPIIVVNLSTSRVHDDLAQKYGAVVIRTKIGEANVARRMLAEKNCLIGGEGNGGVIYPPVHYGRDAATGVALVLEYLAKSGKPLSDLVQGIPQYHIVKEKFAYPREKIPVLLEKIKQQFASEQQVLTDGIKIIYSGPRFSRGWVHIRSSGTEPVVRVIAEAKTVTAAKQLCLQLKNLIEF
ncbi:MAG: phosphoglucosamine mutase [bacterium]|nr:phosphoglucosamine mutase [bacterium]